MDKAALIATIEDCGKQIEAIFKVADDAKRPVTADELTQVTGIEAKQAKAQADLATVESADAARTRAAGRVKVLSESTGRPVKPGSSEPITTTRLDEQGRVVGSFESTDEEVELRFEDSPNATVRKTYRQQKRENAKVLRDSGYKPWAAAGGFGSFREFVTAGHKNHQSTEFRDQHRKHFAAVSGMSEGVGSDGGYLVMPEFSNKILDRVYSNDLWNRTDHYNVTGNSMTFVANAETSRANGSRHGGMRGYWLGEGATKTATKPTLRAITLKLVKLAVVVYLTDELLEDTGSVLSEYVARKAAEEFNFMIGDALVNGTGVGQPLGLLNWPSLISVAKESGQLAATLETENIIKMFSRFYAPNRNNMIWLYNQDVEPELFTMTLGVGAGGVVTYMPPGGLSSAPYATLMGRPSFPTEFNATLGTQGDIIAADLGQMISISKGGIAQATSIHVEFLTDQTALRFVMRLNAGPWESAPLTPYKGTNTTSNAVALDTRA